MCLFYSAYDNLKTQKTNTEINFNSGIINFMADLRHN